MVYGWMLFWAAISWENPLEMASSGEAAPRPYGSLRQFFLVPLSLLPLFRFDR